MKLKLTSGENPYYNPEAHGLTILYEEDLGGSWEFDKFVVWADKEGRLWWDTDSGCSCPSPFENVTELERLFTLDDVLPEYQKYVDAEGERKIKAALEKLKTQGQPLDRLDALVKEVLR